MNVRWVCLECCVLCQHCVFHFPRVGPQCFFGGVTLFGNSVLSALIVFLPGRYDVSSSPFSPPRNLFLESLFMYAFVQFEEKKKKTCQSDSEKKFFAFSPCRRENKFVTEESKESMRKTALWWMVRNRQLQTTYQTLHIEDITHTNTHSTIYAHTVRSRHWRECWALFCGKGDTL